MAKPNTTLLSVSGPLQFEVKHEGQQLLAQRLAIASGEPSEDVPTELLPLAWASVSGPVDQWTIERKH